MSSLGDIMLIKTIIVAAIIAMTFYSEGTNASVLEANNCTIGLPPLTHSSLGFDDRKNIISAFEDKGFFVTIMNSENEIQNQEFYSDVSLECTKTYFATHAQTIIRIVESATEKISAKYITPIKADIFQCKAEIIDAIAALPSCKIK